MAVALSQGDVVVEEEVCVVVAVPLVKDAVVSADDDALDDSAELEAEMLVVLSGFGPRLDETLEDVVHVGQVSDELTDEPVVDQGPQVPELVGWPELVEVLTAGVLVDELVFPVEVGAVVVDEITQSSQLVGFGTGVGLYRLVSFHQDTRHRSQDTEKLRRAVGWYILRRRSERRHCIDQSRGHGHSEVGDGWPGTRTRDHGRPFSTRKND